MDNKVLNFLLTRQEEQKALKTQKIKEIAIKHYSPNEHGFYTMQQCYIINSMLANGAKVESDGSFTYTNKSGATKTHKIDNMTAYNISIDYYEQLRQLGIKNIVELKGWTKEKIELIRKVGDGYFKTIITDKDIQDEPYDGQKELLQFIKV